MAQFTSILILLAATTHSANAFVPRHQLSTRHAVVLSSTSVEAPDEKSSMTTLNLIGEVTKSSEAAPATKNLIDFFSLPDSASLILRGSKNNKIVEITNPDATLLEAYEKQCKIVDAKAPGPDDKFFDVTTSGVQFPGLKVITLATIGVNIFKCNQGLPSYQFVLIKDCTYAEGNRIFVWFFNKVTGKDGSEDNEATTQSLNIIKTVPIGNDKIVFEAKASLRVRVKFPSLLMKVIPNGKLKSEQTGGESLRKVLDADLPVALSRFCEEYKHWLEN